MTLDLSDTQTAELIAVYVGRLKLPTDHLHVTTDRRTFERWIGRRVSTRVGGVYAFRARPRAHFVLIHLARIDRSRPKAVEIVVAEELLHMRDRLDGDLRRHAKHGYDRIAHRVAELTGATLEEVRSCLLPVEQRPFRYVYGCPGCGVRIQRRRRGVWSCAHCAPRFDPRFQLRLVEDRSGR